MIILILISLVILGMIFPAFMMFLMIVVLLSGALGVVCIFLDYLYCLVNHVVVYVRGRINGKT